MSRRHGASPEADYARARLDGLRQQVTTAAPPPGLAVTPPKSEGIRPPLPAVRRTAAFGGIGGDPFGDAKSNPTQLPITGLNVNVTRNPANRNQLIIGMLQAQWGEVGSQFHGNWPPDVPTAGPL